MSYADRQLLRGFTSAAEDVQRSIRDLGLRIAAMDWENYLAEMTRRNFIIMSPRGRAYLAGVSTAFGN